MSAHTGSVAFFIAFRFERIIKAPLNKDLSSTEAMPKPQLGAPTIPTAFVPDFVKWGEDTVRVCQCYGPPEVEMVFLMDIFLKALDSNRYYHPKHTHTPTTW